MGHSVFLTGGAGTGKSYTLASYISYLQEQGISHAVTASTGIAGTHIGGMTIHSWSGIGAKESLTPYEMDALEERKYLWDRYQHTKVLIIDEISMLSGTFLDTLNAVCKMMRRNEAPFGGLQVILCGDLFQLPPVTRGSESLVIDAKAWSELKPVVCYLTEQYRQSDSSFTDILNALRTDTLTDDHITTLQERTITEDAIEDLDVTRIYTHNVHVDTINEEKLKKLAGKQESYTMHTHGKEHHVESLKKSCLAPETLHLKKGAHVLFVKNNPEKGYVNGTRGEVIGFNTQGFPHVRTTSGSEMLVEAAEWSLENDSGKVMAHINQLPLRLAWAITVHKSQGMSLDEAVIDVSKAFAPGMGYVALSRVRSLDGLHLLGFSRHSLVMHPRIKAFELKLQRMSQNAEARLAELSRTELEEKHKAFREASGAVKSGAKKVRREKLERPKKEKKVGPKKKHAWQKTLERFLDGEPLQAIALTQKITHSTAINHLEQAVESGVSIPKKLFADMLPPQRIKRIVSALESVADARPKTESSKPIPLTPTKEFLEERGFDATYEEIRLCRLLLALS